MKKELANLSEDFFGLFYPKLCLGCEKKLFRNEDRLCLHCIARLPRTHFHQIEGNAVEKRFYGKVELQHAASFLYFEKKLITQKILHEIKYRGGKELGERMGRLFGKELSESKFREIDAIVPVPLHPNKLHSRGFNQSERIAVGIGEVMQKPVLDNVLKRVVENPTQTRKNVYERWENAFGIFETENDELAENKHLLLVDDVLTTGSTLEACIRPLLKIKNVKVSVATLAATD